MNFVVAGTGMITSVGQDVVTSCAALRARLERSEEIDYFPILDIESHESIPVIGRPIDGYADGFNIVGWWIQAAMGCIADLKENGGLPPSSDEQFWAETGLMAVTPPVSGSRFGDNDGFTPEMMKEAYLEKLAQILDEPISSHNMDVKCLGHAGTIAAIHHAFSQIEEKKLKRCIVLAVDSYLDPMTLEWLLENNRLKTPDSPVGLIPGEAGSCFLLESRESCEARGGSISAVVHKPAIGEEKINGQNEFPSQGDSIAEVISQALIQSNQDLPFSGDLITDLNGEEWRALQWGSAQLRLIQYLDPDINLILPCNSLGEVGCASGATAVNIAASSFQRNYATTNTTLIVSSSDNGHVGAICLSKN